MGKPVHPFLLPIPVSGPFDWLGVDVIQFTSSSKGKKYAIVFVDYLTKLLVEHVIPRHGEPTQLLSDRGTAFLSKLMVEVNKILGLKKVNITTYHPQTDGLVERFNCTLTDMLSKKVLRSGKDWDTQLYPTSCLHIEPVLSNLQEKAHILLYGRDPNLPTDQMLTPSLDRDDIEISDHRHKIVLWMSSTWKSTQSKIKKAQEHQKILKNCFSTDTLWLQIFMNFGNVLHITKILAPKILVFIGVLQLAI